MRRFYVLLLLGFGLLAAPAPEPSFHQKLVSRYPPESVDPSLPWTPAKEVRAGAVTWRIFPYGVERIEHSAPERDRMQRLFGRRYLPEGTIEAVAPDDAAGIWIRSRHGITHVEYRPFTLAQKAHAFEERIRARHDRYGLVASSVLERPGDLSSNRLEPSDNDGLWTGLYAAAECFRYSVTRDAEALANARKSLDSMLFLEEVTGRPGFPARSYIRKGDMRPSDGVWRWTPDGKYQWKADTSSDEIVGHMFAYGIAFDLLPDAALKSRIAAATARIADHIIEHGYNLTDVTGQPTTWGKWSPAYFAGEGRSDSPLNALELLSFLRSAGHITGKKRYEDEYRKVAYGLGYLDRTQRYLDLREEINYSDEELAMLSFYPLLRYETDARAVEAYRAALAQWWQNIRREENPLWTYIYALSKPTHAPDFGAAAWMLQRIPMELIEWTVTPPPGVKLDGGRDRFGKPETMVLLAPDERPVMKWNANPFRLEGGNGGRAEDDGAFFLLPYWLSRYFRL